MTCFAAQLERSFKVSLGRSGFSGREQHPTAILVSGGPCSAAVAYMYARYISSLPPNPKAPDQEIVLVHVTGADHTARLAVEALATQLNLKLSLAESPEMPSFKDVSDGQVVFRRRLLRSALQTARTLGSSRVLLGTTADRAAVDILSCVISGCGSAVGAAGRDVWTVEPIEAGVTPQRVLRPLLHTPVRLAVRYARAAIGCLRDIEHVGGASSGEQISGHSPSRIVRKRPGLYDALERFVGAAQAENGACVHNVVRTASRLDGSGPSIACGLCGAAYINDDSCKGNPVCAENPLACQEECSVLSNKSSCRSGSAMASEGLCYSCVGAVQRAGGRQGGGAELLLVAERDARRRAMREEIREYLIDEEGTCEDNSSRNGA
jgi:hypothetical protein